MEEIDEAKELQKMQEELGKLRGLVESSGWLLLREYAEGQERARRNEVLYKPLTELGSVLYQEFMKGELSGIELFFRLPNDRIEVLKEALDQSTKENEDGTSSE